MGKQTGYRIQRVLWATDFSSESKHCLKTIAWMSRRLGTGNHAVYVLPKFSDWIYESGVLSDDELMEEVESERKEALTKIKSEGKKHGIDFHATVREGAASEEIMSFSREQEIDLIVAGRRGISQLEEILIGSTTSRLIRNSPVPVMIIPEESSAEQVERILIPVDIGDSDMNELTYAIDIAAQMKAKLLVMHVAEFYNYKVPVLKMDEVKKKIRQRITRLADLKDHPIEEIVFETGEPAHRIIELSRARDVDMIIMTSHQRRGFEKLFLGSVTEKVLMATERPLLVLPFTFISS